MGAFTMIALMQTCGFLHMGARPAAAETSEPPDEEFPEEEFMEDEELALDEELQDEEEGDSVDLTMSLSDELYPWTYNMRRGFINILSPTTTALKKGDWYNRVMHVSQETFHGSDPMHSLLGLDDSVKIGILVARGLTDKLSMYVQRTNGRGVSVSPTSSVKIDYWDLMFKYQFMESQIEYILDFSVLAGVTYMWRDEGGGSDVAYNLGFMVEKSFVYDRLRLGTGALYTSLSVYEGTLGLKEPDAAETKQLPDEYDTFLSLGGTTAPPPDPETIAIPLNMSVALTQNWMMYMESVFPVHGFKTGHGASNAVGFRFNTNTHEYNFYLTDSSNNSFNGVITGGYRSTRLDIFGFSVISHF